MRNSNLPLLEHLSFEGCIFVDAGGPGPANRFELGCPALTDLNIKHCQLSKNEFDFVVGCLGKTDRYSNIRSLVLSLENVELLRLCPWNNIRSIWLHDLNSRMY